MRRTSFELVQRDKDSLLEELQLVSKYKDQIDVINFPDLFRLKFRPWDAAPIAKQFFKSAIPHIRAMDIDLTKDLPMKSAFEENALTEVLIIEGDPPQVAEHIVYPTQTTDVIRKFKDELPNVKIYCGLDQYRSGMRDELYRIERKLQAGCSGFFTQPFYDLRFAEMYFDMLDGMLPRDEIYWGISPILSSSMLSYWERKNRVVFTQGFSESFEWNVNLAKKTIDFAEKHDGSLYFMPISVDLKKYLEGIFGLR